MSLDIYQTDGRALVQLASITDGGDDDHIISVVRKLDPEYARSALFDG